MGMDGRIERRHYGVNYGARIKELRTERHLTQKDLADALGMTQSAVCQFERGSVNVSLPTAKAIADTLGVTLDELCG